MIPSLISTSMASTDLSRFNNQSKGGSDVKHTKIELMQHSSSLLELFIFQHIAYHPGKLLPYAFNTAIYRSTLKAHSGNTVL